MEERLQVLDLLECQKRPIRVSKETYIDRWRSASKWFFHPAVVRSLCFMSS